MFIPIQQARWPAAGEVRDLRFSLNAPWLLGSGPAPQPTRAALGWLPTGSSAVVRLWLRADGAPEAVRGFDLPDAATGPAARAEALERAERFLGGLGFLFSERSSSPACTAGPEAPGSTTLRTSDPDPAAESGGAATTARVTTAVRADVRLTPFRPRGPSASWAGPPGPTGGIDR